MSVRPQFQELLSKIVLAANETWKGMSRGFAEDIASHVVTNKHEIEHKFSARKFPPEDITEKDLDIFPFFLHENRKEKFFVFPTWHTKENGEYSASVQMVVVDGSTKHALTIRYESPENYAADADLDRSTDSHQYWHAQLTKKVGRLWCPTGTPTWLPESYPAIPLPRMRAEEPSDLVLCALVSAAGHPSLVRRFVDGLFQDMTFEDAEAIGLKRRMVELFAP